MHVWDSGKSAFVANLELMDVYGSDSRQRMPNLPLLFRQDLGSWFAVHKGYEALKNSLGED